MLVFRIKILNYWFDLLNIPFPIDEGGGKTGGVCWWPNDWTVEFLLLSMLLLLLFLLVWGCKGGRVVGGNIFIALSFWLDFKFCGFHDDIVLVQNLVRRDDRKN